MTTKASIDMYLKIHTEIVNRYLAKARMVDVRIVGLLQEREPWEAWLQRTNSTTYGILTRERATANLLWIEGADDEGSHRRFRVSVETEYILAIWAAQQYLKFQDQVQALTALGPMESVTNAGNTRYE